MENKKYRNLMFLSVTLILGIFLFKKVRLTSFEEKLLFLAFIYAALLISSIYVAIRTIKSSKYPKKSALLIAIGMSLFFMCDLNVAIFNLAETISINLFKDEYIRFYSGFLIWLFYAPSQLLLTLSGSNKI